MHHPDTIIEYLQPVSGWRKAMPRTVKKQRGVFERPRGSGVWWINFYVKGKQRREKVGRRSDAIALYQSRKADIRRGIKLPETVPGKIVTFGELMDDAIAHARTNNRTAEDYEAKQRILTEDYDFAPRSASEISALMIDQFLTRHCKTPATANRYRAFFSLCFRLGISHEKVKDNPARRVPHRDERGSARLRFLTRDEYKKLSGIIAQKHPHHLQSFIVSVYTGMRWSEQFSLKWAQVDLEDRKIHLPHTKNGTPRVVPLNSVALAALEEQQAAVPHEPSDLVFPLPGPWASWKWWLRPCLAAAKIGDEYVWHSNRHTFCSWLAMAGASIKEIQELAGHKTITMSARYAHLSKDHILQASERLVSPEVQ